MSTITWLHLSDWHQKGPDFDREVVRDKQISHIKDRASIARTLGDIDFVICSGGAAFSGQTAEFETIKATPFQSGT
jgi:hypothetical protein